MGKPLVSQFISMFGLVQLAALEDHWMNATNDYDIRIRDYSIITLYLADKALKIKIPLKILQQDLGEPLDPLFNANKIRE